MYFAVECYSPTEAKRALLGHDLMDVGIVCSNAGGSWEPLHLIDGNGRVQPIPPCFGLTMEAVKILDTLVI